VLPPPWRQFYGMMLLSVYPLWPRWRRKKPIPATNPLQHSLHGRQLPPVNAFVVRHHVRRITQLLIDNRHHRYSYPLACCQAEKNIGRLITITSRKIHGQAGEANWCQPPMADLFGMRLYWPRSA